MTVFTVGIGKDMQELLIASAAKMMLASFSFTDTKEAIPKLRQDFQPAYNLIARVLSDVARKRVAPSELTGLEFELQPRNGRLAVKVTRTLPNSVKPYQLVFFNEHQEPHLVALKRKEQIIAENGETTALLLDLFATL